MTVKNYDFEVLASAARTAETLSNPFTNNYYKGLLLVVDATIEVATAVLTPGIRVKDANGDYNTVYWDAAAAISAIGEYSYLFYPGLLAADYGGTEALSLPAPMEWKFIMAVGDADSMTYSVKGTYLL